MSFTFDATPMGANSNSYITVSEADDYFTGHLDGTTYWSSLTTSTKQAALVQATNRLDMETYGGRRTTTSQRLQWCRLWIVSRDLDPSREYQDIGGMYYRDHLTIPKEVKDATCEMALYYIKEANGEFTIDNNDLETLSQYKIGPLSVSIKSGIKANRLPSKVVSLLNAIGPNGWIGEQALKYER